jgi:hypothetical protein
LAFSTDSCKKNNTQANLALLQHNWAILSITGEALNYVGKPGDFFNFDLDGMLYIYEDGRKDTSAYSLSDQGQSLVLYSIVDEIKSSSPSNLNIAVLTNSELILKSKQFGAVVLDSLSR